MEENAQNGKSESLTWFKYDFFFFLWGYGTKVWHDFLFQERSEMGKESELNSAKIQFFLLIRKNSVSYQAGEKY